MDTKISATKMQEVIQPPAPQPITVVHDYDDLLKRKQEALDQAKLYTQVAADIDLLIARLDKAGCKPTADIIK